MLTASGVCCGSMELLRVAKINVMAAVSPSLALIADR
jgi:hypothetical protein